MRRVVVLGMASWLLASLPAQAALVDDAFKDVPPHHWAAQAIVEMAIKRSLMGGYPDDTFRGDTLFTREQFAQSLRGLLEDLEGISKTSWKTGAPAHDRLSDVPASNPDRATVLALVNDYHLWRNVPAIDGDHFRPDDTIGRSEVAQVVENLLASGEQLGVVRARDPRDPKNPFKDLSPSQWAYQAILADDQRYRVMIGFPDISFRPDEKLTRYQYAAVGAGTFGMIRELVRKSTKERDALNSPIFKRRFQELRPWALSLYPGGALASGGRGFNVNSSVRYVGYPGSWFWTASLRAGVSGGVAGNAGTGLTLTAGAFPQLPTLSLGRVGEFQLQPYVGARFLSDGRIGAGFGLPVLGGVAYWHQPHWGAYLLGDVNFFDVGTNGPSAETDGVLGLGTEYRLSDKFALTGGVGLNKLPSGLDLGPAIGLNFAI